MQSVWSKISSRNRYRSKPAVNRRTTLMLAIGGAVGFVSQAKQARADTRAAKSTLQNLKLLGVEQRVVAIGQRHDVFEVQMADGRKLTFTAVNLHFKIDPSDDGPFAGRPVMLPTGMKGDRATVFVAAASEIGAFVRQQA